MKYTKRMIKAFNSACRKAGVSATASFLNGTDYQMQEIFAAGYRLGKKSAKRPTP